MQIGTLIKELEVKKVNIGGGTEISGICSDNRRVRKGDLFVCIRGAHHDGHDYVKEVLEKGAVGVVCEKAPCGGLPYIEVEDTRHALTLLCAAFYGHPERSFKYVIGITGTNGKTSTSFMLKSIFEAAGIKVGLIGTMRCLLGDRELEADKSGAVLTTPEPELLFRLFAKMRDGGAECLIMEVSSHSLEQKRVDGIRFSAGIFTNLTRDHIDFHGSMENYTAAKKKLFSMCDIGIFNSDDPHSEYMSADVPCKKYFYGVERNEPDFIAKNVLYKGAFGVEYQFLSDDGVCRIKLSIPGNFSVLNSLAAASAAHALGVGNDAIAAGLASIKNVEGRIERLETDTDYSVFIDFAHTPDALENIIKSVRSFTEGRVITLFGCGGDRDRGKRPLMGEIAAKLSDFVVVTSDNSRTEDKNSIISDILGGMRDTPTPYTVIPDRTEAIKFALSDAKTGDSIILAGKGHEEYEIDSTGKHPYSERHIVEAFLNANNH